MQIKGGYYRAKLFQCFCGHLACPTFAVLSMYYCFPLTILVSLRRGWPLSRSAEDESHFDGRPLTWLLSNSSESRSWRQWVDLEHDVCSQAEVLFWDPTFYTLEQSLLDDHVFFSTNRWCSLPWWFQGVYLLRMNLRADTEPARTCPKPIGAMVMV